MKKLLPNYLTISRGLLTLVIIGLFFTACPDKYLWILILFILACLTDWLDGRLARRWQAVSDFGQMFDPLFDKILTISLYFLLLPLFGPGLALIFILLLLRELLVDGLKNYLLTRGQITPAITSAKIKTTLQMLMLLAALSYLLWPQPLLLSLVYGLGWAAVAFAYYSGWFYFKKFQKYFVNVIPTDPDVKSGERRNPFNLTRRDPSTALGMTKKK